MRVVQVNYAYDRALASPAQLLDRYITLTGWAEALAAAGADVLTVQAFHSSANVTRGRLPYVFGDDAAIAAAAAAFGPDVVHVNGLGFPLRTWRLRQRLERGALVVQDHASGAPSRGVLRRAIRRRLLRVADAFLFSTPDQADPWRRAALIGLDQPVYAVMEASTDLRPVAVDEARAASGMTGDPAVLWVGRLNANKDPVTVVEGFERFAARRPGATLTMVYQGGDLLHTVRSRVLASAALRDRVRLAGEVAHDRIAAFFSAADLFVLGSHHEGSGYALMEAMACGAVPAVPDIPPFRALTTALTGPPHMPGVGVLWPPRDADACGRALEAACGRDRRRVIEHFEANLTWEAVGKRAIAIYEEVVRKKRGGPAGPPRALA